MKKIKKYQFGGPRTDKQPERIIGNALNPSSNYVRKKISEDQASAAKSKASQQGRTQRTEMRQAGRTERQANRLNAKMKMAEMKAAQPTKKHGGSMAYKKGGSINHSKKK